VPGERSAPSCNDSVPVTIVRLVRPVVFAVVAACAFLSNGALGSSAADLPSAFDRPATSADRLPFTLAPAAGEGRPYDSRHVATYAGRTRTWDVFVFKQSRPTFRSTRAVEHVCVFVADGRSAGGGCSPTPTFFGPRRHVVASSGRVLAGVVSDRVARLVVIGSAGRAHRVPLSADDGFVFDCRAYNGCACVLDRVQAFDRAGRMITNQSWRSTAPNCRR
jgi:hypothetical protein